MVPDLQFTEFSQTALTEEDYLRECLTIEHEALRQEFIRIPADLAYWGERYAIAVGAHLAAEHDRKVIYAKTHLIVKETAALKGQKISEKDTESWVEQTPEVMTARTTEIEAEATMHLARSRRDALMAKKDMVVSLGAMARSEMGPTHINSRD